MMICCSVEGEVRLIKYIGQIKTIIVKSTGEEVTGEIKLNTKDKIIITVDREDAIFARDKVYFKQDN